MQAVVVAVNKPNSGRLHACVHGQYYTVGVDRISPRVGSLEGGTKVLVRGEGFSTDSYSGANLVFIGEHPCIVNW